jgi:hypothetical protein
VVGFLHLNPLVNRRIPGLRTWQNPARGSFH